MPVEFNPAFRPVGRIFLSADLVGSTAHKQAATIHSSQEPDAWGERQLSPPWLAEIGDFLSQFGAVVDAMWDEYRSAGVGAVLPCGDPPTLWKANGDELIYCKELTDRRQVYACIVVWLRLIKKYSQNRTDASSLKLKSTCWFAGFPVTNTEIFFGTNGSRDFVKYSEDGRLRQIYLRELWYKNPIYRKSMVQDFIGPSIDTGFRLSSYSSPMKLVVSVDIAYFLSTAQIPLGKFKGHYVDELNIYYEGGKNLKGVLDGDEYPLFWIDSNGGGPLEVESKLRKNLSRVEIKEYCEYFYSKHGRRMYTPFIYGEDSSQYGDIPGGYVDFIFSLHKKWSAEKKRYRNEVGYVTKKGGKNLSDKELTSIVKSMSDDGK